MNITIPYNFTPTWYMNSVLKDSKAHRFQVLNWHRKARKTTFAINKLIAEAFTNRAPYWYVGPSYGAAKRTVWDDPMMFGKHIPFWNEPENPVIKKRETELRVDIKTSGGQIYVMGSDRPELMRGPNPAGIILDEFAEQHREVWDEIIQPIARINSKCWVWFLFTPRGRNHAYDIYNLGKKEGNEWNSQTLTVLDSKVFSDQTIAVTKTEMRQQAFMQEFMCEFIEGEGSVFRGVRDAMTSKPERPEIGHLYVMGVDLAKTHDYTVITVYDRDHNNQVYQDRIQRLDWTVQKLRIAECAKHYNNALIKVDATGLGDPIVDDLIRIGLAVEPVKITNTIKREMIEKLIIWIEQRKMQMLPIEETKLEFDNFAYNIGSSGIVRYEAREGYHDDIVISHALAAQALAPLVPTKATTQDSNLRKYYKYLKSGKREGPDEYEEWQG